MTGKIYNGEIKARIIEARFALSGKVATVAKKAGDGVRRGELLAALDRKILQTELDKQLADFEKTRADFEIFNLKQTEIVDDLTKYLKVEKQAQLNVSVKEVELAKARLDQADLFSPVEGIVIDDSNITPGLYVTPSSNPFKILETASLYFEIKIDQEEILAFVNPRHGEVRLPAINKTLAADSRPFFSSEKDFFVRLDLSDKQGLFLSLKGEAVFP